MESSDDSGKLVGKSTVAGPTLEGHFIMTMGQNKRLWNAPAHGVRCSPCRRSAGESLAVF